MQLKAIYTFAIMIMLAIKKRLETHVNKIFIFIQTKIISYMIEKSTNVDKVSIVQLYHLFNTLN